MFLKFPTPNKEGENFHAAKVMNIGEKLVILCNNIAVLHKKGTILCSRNDV